MNAQVLAYLLGDLGMAAQAPGVGQDPRRGGEAALGGGHGGLWRRAGGGQALRDHLPPARPCPPGRRVRRAGHGGALEQPAAVRVRRRGAGHQQRRQRHRAVPGPPRLHQDLRGPDLGARPGGGALHRLRPVRPPRAALRRHRGQVPGRRDHGDLGDAARGPARHPERAAHGGALPGDADPAPPRGEDVLQDGHRDPLRPRAHRALHRRRGVRPDHGHRPARQPGRAPVVGGQGAHRRGRRRSRRPRCRAASTR